MPKFYCEYCGIYLTNSSPATRKEHDQGRKHVQSRIDYFAQILIEAHQEGTLKKINDVFAHEENIPHNFRQDGLVNPLNKTVINTYDWSNWNIDGIEASSIYYMPIPGMNATMPINPNDNNQMFKRLKNLISYNIVQVPQKPAEQPQNAQPSGLAPGKN